MEPLRLVLHDKLGVAGLIILFSIIAMALAAPLIATHDPWMILETEQASILMREEGEWRLSPVIGPRAISGMDTTEELIVAVGREGTIHWYRDGRWTSEDAPVETDLQDVSFSPDGRVLAAGLSGTLILWAGEDWQVLDAPDSTHYQAVVWVGGDQALIVGDNETIWLVDFSANSPEFSLLT